MLLLSLIFLYLINARTITLEKVEVYENVLDYNFNFEGGIKIITNPEDFKFQLGPATITFETSPEQFSSKVKVLDYKQIIEKKPEPKLRLGLQVPLMFDRKFRAAMIRHNLTDGPCFTMEAAKNHLHYLNLMLKLLSGYRSIYDEDESFITPGCVFCNSSCYKDYGSAYRCGWENAVKLFPDIDKRPYSTQIHFFSWYFQWSGLAAHSSEWAWLNYGNYWALIQMMSGQGPFGVYGTTAHEVGHNMGYNHANKPGSRFVKNYHSPDGYGDSGSYMGYGDHWYNIPNPAHWINVNNGRQLFPPWVRRCEDGVIKYRLFAWDYPYTRVFLGDEKRITYRDNDIIDGIKFKYNTAGLIIEYGNSTFNTQLTPLLHGSICMSYHWFEDGYESYMKKGVKFTIGDYSTGREDLGSFAQYLNAEVDDNQGYHASEIPLNYVKVPELDIGTMKFRITKFHAIKAVDPDASLLEEFPKHVVKMEDIPYVEVEVTHLPNVPIVKPTRSAPVPDMLFSPSLIDCKYKNNQYECNYYNDFNYWTYVKQGPSRNNSLPRLYTSKAGDDTKFNGRLGMVSLPGISIGSHSIVTGTMDTEIVRKTSFEFKQMAQSDSSITVDYYPLCALKKMNNQTTIYEPYVFPGLEYERYDVAILNNFNLTKYERVTLRDLYFNDFDINMINANTTNTGILLFRPFAIQQFSRLFLSLENPLGYIRNQHVITRLFSQTSKRIAIENYNALDETYTVIPASLSKRKTSNSFAGPIKMVSNLWYYYPFTDVDVRDYLFVDFEGSVPSDLKIVIETEIGLFEKELGYLSRFNDISVAISIHEISVKTGGWGEIYRFRFNREITLLSLRLSLLPNHKVVIPDGVSFINRTVLIGEDKFQLECGRMERDFKIEEFNVTFLGNVLRFYASDNKYTVREIFSGSMNIFFPIMLIIAIFLI